MRSDECYDMRPVPSIHVPDPVLNCMQKEPTAKQSRKARKGDREPLRRRDDAIDDRKRWQIHGVVL